MSLFVRHSGSGSQILKLFCAFSPVYYVYIPMAVLIGVLLGLGRMSADSEIIALTALGIDASAFCCQLEYWRSPARSRPC